jgi:hypothetical protein
VVTGWRPDDTEDMILSAYHIPAESMHKILAQAGTSNTATSGCTRERRYHKGDGCMEAALEFEQGVGHGLLHTDFAYRMSSYSTGFYSRLRALMSYSLYIESLP